MRVPSVNGRKVEGSNSISDNIFDRSIILLSSKIDVKCSAMMLYYVFPDSIVIHVVFCGNTMSLKYHKGSHLIQRQTVEPTYIERGIGLLHMMVSV